MQSKNRWRAGLAFLAILGLPFGARCQDHAAAYASGAVTSDASASAAIDAARKIYDEQGPKAALPEFQMLLSRFEKAGDRRSEGLALGMIANCYRGFDDFSRALDFAQRGLAIKRELGDVAGQGRSYNQLGLIYWEESDYSRGAQNFEHAIQIANETGDRQLEASARNNLGLVEGDSGDYAKAAPEHQRAVEISREIGFKRGESDALGNLGGVKMLLGRFGEAIPYYEEALKIDEEQGLKPRESLDLGNLGKCQSALGRTDDALKSFDRAIQLARDAGVKRDLADWQRGKGDALEKAGKYQAAIAEYEQAQKTYEAAGLKRELANLLNSTGSVHLLLGDISSGERDFSRGLNIAREIHNPAAIVLNQLALGEIATRRSQFVEGEHIFSEASAVARRAGDLAAEFEGLMSLSRAELSAGNLASAERDGERVGEVAKEMRNPPAEAEALVTLGDVMRARTHATEALDKYDAAAEIGKTFADPELKWRLHYGRGQAMEALGRLEDARTEYQSSIATIESVRSELGTERYRSGYLQDRYQVYIALVELLLKLQKPDQAFVYSERMRARSYLDELSGGGASEDGESTEETALRERIGRLRRGISGEWGKRNAQRQQNAIEQYSTELSEAERAYEELLDRRSKIITAAAGTSVDLADTQSQLKPGSAVIEYVVGQKQLDILVIGRSEAHAVAVPIAKSQLESRLELLRYFISRPETEQWRSPAASLRRLLIDPIEKAGWLRGITRLYIAPDDVLNYVPFAALPTGSGATSRYLIQDYVIGYVPTAAVLQAASAGDRAAGVMAIAPARARLRWSGPEAREVVQISPENSRLLDGRAATETTFKESAGNFDVLHLATHGYLNRAAPMLSALELEPDAENDGRLEVHEILQLKLKAQLVTLSACETALGSGYFSDVPAGDEFVGLTRAFLSAGARSVVASLWQVDDRSTLELMGRFYRQRKAESDDNAAALAKTQRKMSAAGGRYSHPYYWAPFVVVGN